MTELTITPDIAKKKLKLAGVAASGEKVAVTIAGFGTASTGNLKLRVMAGDVPVGIFPLEDGDEWAVSGADLACTLNLSTEQAERHCRFGAEVCFVLEDTGTPQLYGVGGFTLRPWIKLAGVDVPVNLDNYKVRMDAVLSEISRVESLANGKYGKPETGIPASDLSQSVQTSLAKADSVTLKVSKSAFDVLLGLSLPDSATQRDTRQIVQRILSVLQNACVCIALTFAIPSFGIDADTAWEEVPPQNKVKNVVEQFSPPADFSTNNTKLIGTIRRVAPAPGDYANVSNRAVNALQTNLESFAVGAYSYATNIAIAVGSLAQARGEYSAAIGRWAIAGDDDAYALGNWAWAYGFGSLALGISARTEYGATNAVQIGEGVNNEQKTLKFLNYKLVDAKGDIPEARVRAAVTNIVAGMDIAADEEDPVWELEKGEYAKTNAVAAVAAIVDTWEGYWGGTNVLFEVTNYYGNTSGEIPRLRIKELMAGGEYAGTYRTVWDEASKFHVCKTNILAAVAASNSACRAACAADLSDGLASRAPLAWGAVTDKGATNVVGNSVWMTSPETYFAGGTEYQRVAVGSGTICVLADNGAGAYTAGEAGTFRFQDDGGTNYFGFAKSDSYTIGCNTDGITVSGNLVTLRYDVIMGGTDVPIVYWRPSLSDGSWAQVNNADGTAADGAAYTVTWYTSGGSYYAAINCGDNASGFFKAETSVAGDVVFETNMKARLGGGIECENTATGVMGVIRPTYNGSGVTWTWSAR